MKECMGCGKQLLDDMRFCPYCGRAMAEEDLERFEPARGEVVISVISPVRVTGREGTYALVLTEERLIFARIKDVAADKAKSELRQLGIFMPGSSGSDNVSRFYEMAPGQVLAESPDNQAVDVSDVLSVRLSYDGDGTGAYVVRFRLEEGELTVTIPYERYYRDLLIRMFEGRISW